MHTHRVACCPHPGVSLSPDPVRLRTPGHGSIRPSRAPVCACGERCGLGGCPVGGGFDSCFLLLLTQPQEVTESGEDSRVSARPNTWLPERGCVGGGKGSKPSRKVPEKGRDPPRGAKPGRSWQASQATAQVIMIRASCQDTEAEELQGSQPTAQAPTLPRFSRTRPGAWGGVSLSS